MTRQRRTIAVAALSVLLLHIGALWALQQGLLVRPPMVSPPIPMQVRLVTPATAADETPLVPVAGRTRETDLPKLAPPPRRPGTPPLNTAPASSLVPGPQPEPAPESSRPGALATQTRGLQTAAAEPTRMPAKTTVAPTSAISAGPAPATDIAVVKPSVTGDDAGSGPASAAVAITASAVPTTRRYPAAEQLPSTDAHYLQNPPPHYPPISRRLREQGTVLVDVLVTDQGLARETRIQQSSGFFRLDNAAAATVATWRFVPGKRAGVAQSMWFTVPIDFQLQ